MREGPGVTAAPEPLDLAALREWRPIETYRPGIDPDYALVAGTYPNGVQWVDAAHHHTMIGWQGRAIHPPTHWMPFPAPPELAP